MKEKKILWKECLNEIIKISPQHYAGHFDDNNHTIAKRLKISGKGLLKTIQFLQEHKLIEIKDNLSKGGIYLYSEIVLTQKGFDIIQKNENEIRLENNTRTTLFLTSMIALTTIATFLMNWGVEKLTLLTFYLIFSTLLSIYFKEAKTIKV